MDKNATNTVNRDNDLSHIMNNLNEESHFIKLDDRNQSLLEPSILSNEGEINMKIASNNLVTPNALITPNPHTDRSHQKKLPNPFEKHNHTEYDKCTIQ